MESCIIIVHSVYDNWTASDLFSITCVRQNQLKKCPVLTDPVLNKGVLCIVVLGIMCWLVDYQSDLTSVSD